MPYYLISQQGIKKHLTNKDTNQADINLIKNKIQKKLSLLPDETKTTYIKNNHLENQDYEWIWKDLLINILYAASQVPLNQIALELDRQKSSYMLSEVNFNVNFYIIKDQIITQQIAYRILKSPQHMPGTKKDKHFKVKIIVEVSYLTNKNKMFIQMEPNLELSSTSL